MGRSTRLLDYTQRPDAAPPIFFQGHWIERDKRHSVVTHVDSRAERAFTGEWCCLAAGLTRVRGRVSQERRTVCQEWPSPGGNGQPASRVLKMVHGRLGVDKGASGSDLVGVPG